MSGGEYRFHSSFFGFNRQDVIRYIEAIHKDYAAKLDGVRRELAQEKDQRSRVEEQGSLASEEAAAAGKDAQRSREELTRAQEELRQAQSEREEFRLKLQAVTQELNKLQADVERMAPAAQAYESLKERAAGIELDAHNRAQTIIREGEAKAAQTRQQVALWLRQVESSYTRLRSDVAASLTHAKSELERTSRSLDTVNAELESHGQSLTEITEQPADPAQED